MTKQRPEEVFPTLLGQERAGGTAVDELREQAQRIRSIKRKRDLKVKPGRVQKNYEIPQEVAAAIEELAASNDISCTASNLVAVILAQWLNSDRPLPDRGTWRPSLGRRYRKIPIPPIKPKGTP